MAYAYLSDTKVDIHKLYPTDFIFIFIVVACSMLGLNAYRFGDGMQLTQLTLLKQWIENGALNPDVWTTEVFPHYYSVFWPGIAWICKQVTIPIEWLFLAFYVFFLIFIYSGLFRLGLVITGDRGATYLSLAMMVFSIEAIPGLPTISHHIEPYHVALPFMLHGVWLWLAGRPIQGFALIGLGAIFHPLIGFYAVAFTLPFGFFPGYQRPVGEVILALFALAITSGPFWVWRMINPDPAFDAFYYDSNWINQVQLASGQLWNPLLWKWYSLINIVLACTAILLCSMSLPSSNQIRWFSIMIVPTYLLMVGISIVFTNVFPFPLFIQLQLPRALPFVLIFSLPAVSLFLRNQVFNNGFTTKSMVLIGILFLLFLPENFIDGLGFLAIVLLVMFYLRSTSSRSYYERTLPLLLALMLGISSGLNYLFLPRFSLLNVQNMEWQAIQNWAKKNTEKNAVFIFNPSVNGFRYGAERSVWLDWDEGMMGRYSMAFSAYWQKQVNWLKASSKQDASEKFEKLGRTDFEQIAKQYRNQPVYAVVKLTVELPGTPVTESTNYQIVKIQ